MSCPNCGAENEPGSSFCNNCGMNLASPAEAAASQAGQPPVFPSGQEPHAQAFPGRYPTGYQVQPMLVAQVTDGSCIAALVLGIVSLAMFWIPYVSWILGILALVFGSVGMKNVQQNPGAKTGYGMGLAGLITGAVGIVAATVLFIVAVAIYA